MGVRVTIEMPDRVHRYLHRRAEQSHVSMRSLIINALEHAYPAPEEEASTSRLLDSDPNPMRLAARRQRKPV